MAAKCTVGALVLVMIWCAFAPAAAAEEAAVDFDYDIFLAADSVLLWIDLTPALSQTLMEDLLAGLTINIGLDVRLEKPPHPILAKTIVRRKFVLAISRNLNHDSYFLKIFRDRPDSLSFVSQMALSDYLADSLEFLIMPASQVKATENLRISLEIISKSYSNKVLPPSAKARPESGQASEPAESDLITEIFSEFLDLIGFGRNSYKLITPDFTLSDLDSYPAHN